MSVIVFVDEEAHLVRVWRAHCLVCRGRGDLVPPRDCHRAPLPAYDHCANRMVTLWQPPVEPVHVQGPEAALGFGFREAWRSIPFNCRGEDERSR